MTNTPIYDQLLRELYAERAREAYAKSPDMIGCGQWELPPEGFTRPPRYARPRRERTAEPDDIFYCGRGPCCLRDGHRGKCQM